MRRVDIATGKAVGIATLLIGHDEKNIGTTFGHGLLLCFPLRRREPVPLQGQFVSCRYVVAMELLVCIFVWTE